MITQEELKEVLHYNPNTGVFKRRAVQGDNKSAKKSTTGYVTNDGYLVMWVKNAQYLSHRLAWLYVYGYLNKNPSDNRIKNLREASRQCNSRNTGNWANNTSGVKGVCWRKREKKWVATIVINKNKKHLGYYKDFDNAVCARLAVEQCLDWSDCDSSSPAYKYVQKILEG